MLGVDTHACQLVDGDKYIDDLCLRTEECHFHDTVRSNDLCLDTLCPVAHLLVGESVIGYQPVIDAEHIAEVI